MELIGKSLTARPYHDLMKDWLFMWVTLFRINVTVLGREIELHDLTESWTHR